MMMKPYLEDQQVFGQTVRHIGGIDSRFTCLGQYAVVWRDGKPVVTGEDAPKSSGEL
jgi:hypothetical protein